MKILLVDDDAFLRDMYASKFLSAGHDVETADGSASALTKFPEGVVYDVVLLDMVMPGTSGVELLEVLKKQFPNQVKLFIFLSNQGQEADISEAAEAGAVGYIIKAHSIPSEVVRSVMQIVAEQTNK